MRLPVVTVLLHVAAVSALTRQTDCNFGADCPFACHCASPELCDPLTGCQGACLENQPLNYPPGQSGWEGDGCQTGNLAYNKTAWQHRGYEDRVASLAVDGVVNRLASGVAQPSGPGSRAWWSVDLGALHTVYSTRLMNTDLENGYSYMNHIRVYVSNSSIPDNNTVLNTEDDIMRYGDFVTCGEFADTVESGMDADVQCEQPLVGRYVLVYKYDTTGGGDPLVTFVVSEVTVQGHRYEDCNNCATDCNSVYGCITNCAPGKNQTTFCLADCNNGTFGLNCDEICSGHCANGDVCTKINGTCPRGCELWWKGSLCDTEIAPPDSNIVHTLAAHDVTSGDVTLTWDPMENIRAGLESHYGYIIGQQSHQDQRQKIMADDTWTDIAKINYTETVDTESHTVRGLIHNSLFSFRLQVYRQDQGTVDRATDNGTVDVKTSCIVPSQAPTLSVDIFSSVYGNATYKAANVTWDLIVPDVSGCDFIREYIFSYQPDGGDFIDKQLDNTTSYFVLSENTTQSYVVKVAAINNQNLAITSETIVELDMYCHDGFYGRHCDGSCSGNCANGTLCEKTDGSCTGGCESWWLDPLCATEIAPPASDIVHSLTAPDVTSGDVTLTWDPLENIQSGLESHYGYVIGQQSHQDQRLETMAGDPWTDIAWINYTETVDTESYTVQGLDYNSRFSFRLQVYRQDQAEVDRATDNATVDVKTMCVRPPEPVVTAHVSNASLREAAFQEAYITWDLMTPADSGCDYISSYQVLYRLSDDTSDPKELTLDNTTNVFLLLPDESGTYIVRVAANNNGGFESFTDISVNLELYSPDYYEESTEDIALLVAMVVGWICFGVSLVFIVVLVIRYHITSPPRKGETSSSTSFQAVVSPDSVYAECGNGDSTGHTGPSERAAPPAEYQSIVPVPTAPSEYACLNNSGPVYQNVVNVMDE